MLDATTEKSEASESPPSWIGIKHLLAVAMVMIVFSFISNASAVEETDTNRLWVTAIINGESARLQLDTGTSELVLFSNAVSRLNLSVSPIAETERRLYPPPVIGKTGLCVVGVGFDILKTHFVVIPDPPQDEIGEDIGDGIIGWENIDHNLFRLDLGGDGFSPLEGLPTNLQEYSRFEIDTTNNILSLLRQIDGNHRLVLLVDSGAIGGLRLPMKKWDRWKMAHPAQPVTIVGYLQVSGAHVLETTWAESYTIGPVICSGVECIRDPTISESVDASLGLDALKHFDLILDGPHKVAYVKARPINRGGSRQHNRLGALFMPEAQKSDVLIAQVARSSFAEQAGIKTGDVLLKIDDLDVTHWRTDPRLMPMRKFWEQPSGTQMTLTLKRGEQILTKKVVLRNILPPDY